VLLQLNVNGLRNTSHELSNFLAQHSIKIACLQETKLNAKFKSCSFPNYAIVRKDRPVGKGGGLITLIHNSIFFTNIDSSLFSAQDLSMELLGITASIGGS
jgi:exonuclease III